MTESGSMLVSVEERLSAPTVTASGILKRLREPVIVALGATRAEGILACSVLFLHAGLEPGPYELVSEAGERFTAVIPPGLSGTSHRLVQNAQLETYAQEEA